MAQFDTRITPCLWFDRNAEEAARFYVSLFPNSSIDRMTPYGADSPSGKKGDPMLVEFTLSGIPFQGLNGGPMFQFTEAVSFSIACDDQAEVDRYWEAFTSEGGSESMCGWCKDRFGLSWQVVPKRFVELHVEGSDEQIGRMFAAVMTMRKLDIAALEAAFHGEG